MTTFGYISDYTKRLEISETAIPERYRDDVEDLAIQLRREDIKKGSEVLSLDEYKEKAVAIIREKTCATDVVILAECLKYKHESANEGSDRQIFSDDWYLNYALTQIQLRNFGLVQAKYEENVTPSNPCPDDAWAGYTYEEILQMYNDGVNIPQEVVEWAQGLKESDVISYIIDEDINVNTDGEFSDLNSLEQKLKKYVVDVDTKKDTIKEKLEEIKEYKKSLAQIKAKNSSQESELGQLKLQMAELKVLNSKQIRKGLTASEQSRFQNLKATLQGSSALFETVNNNIVLMQTFSTKINELQSECIEAQNVMQETTNLTTNITALINNSANCNKNMNVTTSSQISNSGENAIYGVSISELPNVAIKYCNECESTVKSATSFINSCAQLNQFCEKYMMLAQTIGSVDNLKSGFSIALPTGSVATVQSETATAEESVTEENSNPYGIEEVGSGSPFSVLAGMPTSFLSVAAMIAGVSSYVIMGITALSALLCSANKSSTEEQTNSRNIVKEGTDALEAGNNSAITFTNQTSETVSSLHKLFYDKTKNSDKLMKEMLKLFDDKKKIRQETEKKSEQRQAKAEAENQEIEAEAEQKTEEMQAENSQNDANNTNQNNANPDDPNANSGNNADGAPVQNDQNNAENTDNAGQDEINAKLEAKAKENEKEDKDAKKSEAKELKAKDKKIDKITKKVGTFSKEKKEIINKIEKRIPENDKVMKENDAAGKLMETNSKNLDTTANYLNLQSTGRKIDGILNITRGALGVVLGLTLMAMGAVLLCSPWTCALGKYFIKQGAKGALVSGLMGMQGINDVQTANKGLDEVSDSKNQCSSTNSMVNAVNNEDKREATVIANAADVVETLTDKSEESDKQNSEKKEKAEKKDKKDEQAEAAKEKAEKKAEEQKEQKETQAQESTAAAASVTPVVQAEPAASEQFSLQESIQSINENSSDKKTEVNNTVTTVNNSNQNNNTNNSVTTTQPNVANTNTNNAAVNVVTPNAKAQSSTKTNTTSNKTTAASNSSKTSSVSQNSDKSKSDKNDDSDNEVTSLNETVKKFIYQKLRELGVSKYQLDKVVMPQVNVTSVVNDIKSRIAKGADVQEAIEDAMIEAMNSLDINFDEDKKMSKYIYQKEETPVDSTLAKKKFMRKAGMRQTGEENGLEDISALAGQTVADSAKRPANTNAKVASNVNIAANNDENASDETETNKNTDGNNKLAAKRASSIVAMAQAIKTPDVEAEDKKEPQIILKNNISSLETLQDELNELSNNASMNLASSLKAKSTLSSVLNNQLDKLNLLMKGNNAEEPDFGIDEKELNEMDAIINASENTGLAASASYNADLDEQDNLNNKYKEKLSRFNSTSIDDLKQKRKKISAVLSLSNRKSKK